MRDELPTDGGTLTIEGNLAEPAADAAPAPAPVEPWVKTETSAPAATVNPEPAAQIVAPQLTPDVPKPEAPEPQPAPKEEPRNAEDLLREQLQMAQDERARLKGLVDRQLERERLVYLRNIGAKLDMPDSDLLALAPSVDTTTAEGRATIDQWRQQSAIYFNARQMQTAPDPSEIVKGFKESKHGTFTQETALKILQKMTGSEQ